jgi:hypothetical protein
MATLYNKYVIQKYGGEPVDPEAQYFVLRIDTDHHARVALAAYADSVREEDPAFAAELDGWVRDVALEAFCPFCGELAEPELGACRACYALEVGSLATDDIEMMGPEWYEDDDG